MNTRAYQPAPNRTEWLALFLVLGLLAALLQAGSPGFHVFDDGVWTLAKHFPKSTQQRIEKRQKERRGKKEANKTRREQAVPVAADIPNHYLGLYQRHAPDWWEVVAGVYKIESDHGQSRAPGVRSGVNAFGCCAGPGQFNLRNGPPSTWESWRPRRNANVYDPNDSVPATVKMLSAYMKSPVDRTCSRSQAHGYSVRVVDALMHYNPSCRYVGDVLSWAVTYRKAPPLIGTTANPKGLTFTDVHGCDVTGDWKNWERRGLSPQMRGFILKMAARYSFRISCLRTGHSQYVRGTGRQSAHFTGYAMDVDEVNGVSVSPSTPSTDFGRLALDYGAKQVGGPVELCSRPARRCFTNAGHQGHWHIQP